ncbi:hypothetical protein QEZ54_17860 [Catellatospora sp. KI3]|uniref:hypothetical protein n=1 Tax=Catellatospora sp. KI3 TaxID=3041620 RepID=UPI0024830A24|nr:hypothetical protein [Catellatospora sp. KI3]MDI1462845.1 hypothetical protein [Catellatospora sp. KI3]
MEGSGDPGMTTACLTHELASTSTANWYTKQLAPGRTRALHIRALAVHIATTGLVPLHRDEVLASVSLPQSTLYHQFGPSADTSLLHACRDDIGRSQQPGPFQIGMGLVAEAKVWSYWPFRQGWLFELSRTNHHDRRLAAETLVRVTASWAQGHPALATALGAAPPIAVIEDLLVICADDSLVPRITSLLGEVVRRAVDPLGLSALAVLNGVRGELFALLDGEAIDSTPSVAALINESLAHLACRLGDMPEDERDRLQHQLSPQLRLLLDLLGARVR